MLNITYRLQRKIKHIYRSFFASTEFIYKSKEGFKIKLNYTKDVDRFFYWGQFEYNNLELFKKVLTNDSVVFDIGANIGIYTLIASACTTSGGHVHSFEPADAAYDRLCQNIELNKFRNVTANKLGMADKSGILNFYVCEDDAYNSLGTKPMTAVKKIEKINVTCIDDYCSKNNIGKIDIIKIDTEGADYLVLNGAKRTLNSSNKPILFCEYNVPTEGGFQYTNKDFYQFLIEAGYKVFFFEGSKLNLFNPEIHSFPEIVCLTDDHIKKFNIPVS